MSDEHESDYYPMSDQQIMDQHRDEYQNRLAAKCAGKVEQAALVLPVLNSLRADLLQDRSEFMYVSRLCASKVNVAITQLMRGVSAKEVELLIEEEAMTKWAEEDAIRLASCK